MLDLLKGEAAVDQGLDIIRLQDEGPVMGHYCLVQTLETLQRETAAGMI